MTNRPVIGITPDVEQRRPGAQECEYVLRGNYADALSEAGALPVILPYGSQDVENYLGRLDGVVVSGGFFDIDPRDYGQICQLSTLTTKPSRTAFERALLEAAIVRSVPVLGICNGMQLLAVTLGGELIQHIPAQVKGALEHRPDLPGSEVAHPIRFNDLAAVHGLAIDDDVWVNSVHHQATAEGSGRFDVLATSPDGVVEMIRGHTPGLSLGVQWHPEYRIGAVDRAIIELFVAAARRRS